MAINLIPQETKPKTAFVNLSKKLRRLAVASMIVLIFTLVVLIGSTIILDFRIRKGEERQEELISQIKALELTEKKLYLIKDRVGIYEEIGKSKGTDEEIQILKEVGQNIETNIILSEADMDSDRLNITLLIPDSTSFVKILSSMISNNYKYLEMLSFSLDKSVGYKVEFSINK